jgi:hypothetical protein
VPTSQPLGDILRNKEASGRIGKYATELSQFKIIKIKNNNQIPGTGRLHGRLDASGPE